MSGARFLTRDPIEVLTRSPYAYVYNNPTNLIDPTGLGVLDTIGGFFVGEGCGDDGLLGGIGELASGLWDHRVGALQVVSVGLAVTALAIAPATGGTSLAALPTILGAGSIGSSVLAEAIDPKPGRAQRVTFALGLGLLGGSVAGSFSERGLAAVGVVMDVLLIGGDFIEVGQPNPRHG